MKNNLLALLATFLIQMGALAQTSYYWSVDKKVLVDFNYQIVSVPYNGTANKATLASTFGIKGEEVKAVERIHEKINRIDFVNAVSPVFSGSIKQQIIPSLSIGKNPHEPIFMTGEITIMPNGKTQIDDIVRKYRLTLIKKLNYGPYLLKVPEPAKTLEVANTIHENENVEWASPDLLAPYVSLNDPLYNSQFYLKNTGQLGGTAGIDIKAEEAWTITKGCYIRVAVLDDGIDAHEEWSNGRLLAGHTAGSLNTGGAPAISTPTFDEAGRQTHGVACAGIIGASHDNNLGIKGIAPNTYLIPVNILSNPLNPDIGFTGVEIAAAITWSVASNGGNADILSNSWGIDIEGFSDGNIQVALNNARTGGRGGKGAIIVFASGNFNQFWSGVAFPGSQLNNITVGAITNQGNIWDYSSRGSSMDLVAPSGALENLGNVTTTDRMGVNGTEPGNYANTFGGTSAAAPQVAGVAALMLSVNPALTETQVRTKLQQTATDMGASGFDNTFGYGRLNAYAAVMSAKPALFISGPEQICPSGTFVVSNVPSGATINWSSSNTSILTINSSTGVATRVGDGDATITATVSYFTGCAAFALTKTVKVGKPAISFTVNGQPFQNGQVCSGQTQYIDVVGHSPLNSYTWTLQNGSGSLSGSGPYASFINYNVECSGISVVASNSCGTINTGLTICTRNCFMAAYNVYPNPAKDFINVTFEDTKALSTLPDQILLYNEKSRTPVTTVRIKDIYDQGSFKNGNTIELQVNDLPRGTYYLHILPPSGSDQKTDKIRIILE